MRSKAISHRLPVAHVAPVDIRCKTELGVSVSGVHTLLFQACRLCSTLYKVILV